MKLAILLCLMAAPMAADTVFATRTVRSQSVITAEDVTLKEGVLPGTLSALSQAIGRESRVVLYAGRPILADDITAPALIERNQIVTLIVSQNGLKISTEGRALERGAVGDMVKAMNLSSRSTVNGTVTADGHIQIGQ
ncbi:MAG: flagellar basal body P-ring formation chaperone FlgA [Pseudomonadota bacterium]